MAAPAAGGPSNATPSEFNHPAAAAIPEDWSALLDRNREPTLAGAPPPLDVPPPENLLQALHEEMEALTPEQRAGQLRVLEELRTEAQALIAARETARQRTPAQPAAGSSSRAPPAPPRRTRYQARLRSAQVLSVQQIVHRTIWCLFVQHLLMPVSFGDVRLDGLSQWPVYC